MKKRQQNWDKMFELNSISAIETGIEKNKLLAQRPISGNKTNSPNKDKDKLSLGCPNFLTDTKSTKMIETIY